MKRRDFFKTSVGAGFLVSTSNRDLFTPNAAQQAPGTMFDKIWDAHVITNLGGRTDLLQVDGASAVVPTRCWI